MRPTEELKKEHQAILRMLDILRGVVARLETEGSPVEAEDLAQIVDFIRVFADQCHHGKEEDLLFPAMEAAGIPREGGPIGVMLQEHTIGRDHVRGMAEAVKGCQAGDPQARRAFAQEASAYRDLLSQHITKEDNILYMMADMHLTPETERELLEAFERVEREKIGPGRHEAFHALLDRLEQTYLGR